MNKKKSSGELLGAAFIMATSAIGPGFLTQTATFTNTLKGSFGFVIVVAVALSAVAQLNVWKVLCGSGFRGQDIANKVLPGLGYFVSFMVVLGGLVFNIGNVGGGGLGFNALLGLPLEVGYILAAAIAICVFLLKDAMKMMDKITKTLGGIMIIIIVVMIFIIQPPVGEALKETVMPAAEFSALSSAILTLTGGTVGGYITFAGAHRLIDANITGDKNAKEITKSSVMGMGIASIVRVLLFLAVFGVVVKTGVDLTANSIGINNPAAEAFKAGAGEIGYRFFGLVLVCAASTSIIGAAYTSVSFLKTFHKKIADNEKRFVIAFIALSAIVMIIVGSPATLLVLAGAFNGLILPITLGVCLIASQKKSIMGENYKHSKVLLVLGIVVVIITAYLGIPALGNLATLFG